MRRSLRGYAGRAAGRPAVAIVAAASLIAVNGGVLRAADATDVPTQILHFEHLGPEEGLAHNTANAIIQDRQGFIWIATDDGLDRYDGYEFRHFRLDPARGVTNVFTNLLEDSSETLWVGARGGLLRFDRERETFETVALTGPRPPRPDPEVTAIEEDAAGRLWVAQGANLFVHDPDQDEFRHVLEVEKSGPSSELILEIEVSPSGELWLLLGDSAYRTTAVLRLGSDGAVERYPLSGRQAFGRAFHLDRQGMLWLAAARAPQALPIAHRMPPELPDSTAVQVVVRGSDGTFWIGTAGGGLYSVQPEVPSSLRRHALGQGWQANYVVDLLIDRAGSLWVATLGGAWRYDPGARPFHHLGASRGSKQGLAVPAVSSVREGPTGDLWVGTFGGGLHRIDPASGRIEHFRHDASDPSSLCDDTIWALHVDAAGRLWIGGATALCRLDPGSGGFLQVEPPGKWNRPLDTRVIGGTSDGSILVGFSVRGLWRLNPKTSRWTPLLQIDGQLTSLQVIDGSEIWIGFHTGVLARADLRTGSLGRIELHDAAGERLAFLTIFDMSRTQDGRLWLATNSGLQRFDPATEVLERPLAADALPGTVAFSVEPDAAGRLWVGTNQGLARVDPDAPAEGGVLVFDRDDGLGNIEFNRGAAIRTAAGAMVFGGMSGLTVFQPEEVRRNETPPPVVLTQVSILGREGDRAIHARGVQRVTLTPSDRAVSFEFAALNFIATEKNRYAYRLEGVDPDWVEAGTRRFARYAGLVPGEYVFHVKGSNNQGVWSRAEIALPLTVLPPFWQTAWFRLLVVLAVGTLLYAVYRMRIRRLLEMEQMRLRIASDLHDELSGELSSIALSSSIARRQVYLAEPERRRLEEIESTSRQVISGLRDLVWAINPEHDTLTATVRRMRSAASQLLEGLEWSFEESWTGADGAVAMTVRRDLYLILKEALTNIARHAEATRVTIRLVRHDDRLRLQIADDGRGFDPLSESFGSGLASMRLRAERVGANLTIDTSPMGTTIHLELPLAAVRSNGETSGWRPRHGRS